VWDDRFLFVASSLVALVWGFLVGPVDSKSSRGLIIGSITCVVGSVVFFRAVEFWRELSFPNSGSIIAVLLGAVVGTFAGKFVWSLFKPNFGMRDPLLGAATLLLVVIVYSLPLYREELRDLFGGSSLSNVKTPFVELTFATEGGTRARSGSTSAAGQQTGSQATAVPKPSDPSGGLKWLEQDISDLKDQTFAADRSYIDFLEPKPVDGRDLDVVKVLLDRSQNFLRPLKSLSTCLATYVKFVPDSQLLLIDMAPVLQALFLIHARTRQDFEFVKRAERYGEIETPDREPVLIFSSELEARDLKDATAKVLKNVRGTIRDAWQPSTGSLAMPDATSYTSLIRAIENAADLLPNKQDTKLVRYTPAEEDSIAVAFSTYSTLKQNHAEDGTTVILPRDLLSFVRAVLNGRQRTDPNNVMHEWNPKDDEVAQIVSLVEENWGLGPAPDKTSASPFIDCHDRGGIWDEADYGEDLPFFYFQPYTTLVLSDLLVARGAPDEAVKVLAEWLTDWTEIKRLSSRYPNWKGGIVAKHLGVLPDWFAVRVASRIAVYLSDLVGQNNGALREVVEFYKTSLESYAARSDQHISFEGMHAKCSNKPTSAAPSSETERRVFWLLENIESDSIRISLGFLAEQDSFESLDALQRRAAILADFSSNCLPTTNQFAKPDYRTATLADYRITAGLASLAASERMSKIARSAGDRLRAEEAQKEGETWLRTGWGDLKPTVLQQRAEIRELPWEDRVFSLSEWEGSAGLAVRALSQLRPGSD
jgi:hypothetical protein